MLTSDVAISLGAKKTSAASIEMINAIAALVAFAIAANGLHDVYLDYKHGDISRTYFFITGTLFLVMVVVGIVLIMETSL